MNHNLKYGLYAGFINVAFYIALYLIDFKLILQPGIGLLPFAVTVAILIIAGRDLRAQQDGYLPFKQAFLSSFIIYVIASAIGTLYSILQYNVIAPEATLELQEAVVDQTVGMLESFGADDETIDQTVAEMENSNQFSVGKQLIGFGVSLIWGLIVAAIIGAIVKKNKPEFE